MADAEYGEGRSFNLHAAGTDRVEGSALAVKGASGAIAVDGKTVGSVNALYVAISDGSGNQITTFGGGTQYAEDAPLGAVGSATGTISLGRASDAAPTSVSADADATAIWVSRFGALNVIIRDTAGAALPTGAQYIEDAALGSTGQGTLVVARRDDALATLTPVEDDAIGIKVNSRGALWVSIADGSGNQITTFGGGTQYVEDVGLGGTGVPTGSLSMARGSTAVPTAVGTDGDAVGLWATRSGILNVRLVSGSGTAYDMSQPYTAHDAPGVGSLVMPIAGWASVAAPAAVDADGDATLPWMSRFGALNVILRDTAGAAVATGTQYVGDGLATATPTGTVTMGLANAAAPTDVSANNDAVAQWMLRNGAAVVNLASGGTLLTVGAKTSAASFPVVLASDQAALPVTDNAGSLTVDAPVGTPAYVRLSDGAAAMVGQKAMAASLPVALSSDQSALPITDNAGSLTVDAPVGTPVYMRLSDGASALIGQKTAAASLPVVLASDQTSVTVIGPTAADAALTVAPQTIGARASTAVPTAVGADGRVVNLWANRNGAQVIALPPHIGLNGDPFTLTSKTAQYTTQQTGVALWTPAGGKKLVITKVVIGVGGTTEGTIQVWFGASADTTYSRGTDLAIFDHEFAPTTALKPGVVLDGPWIASAVDHVLRVTDSAAMNPITVTAWGYEV